MGANFVTRTYLTDDKALIRKSFKAEIDQSRVEDGNSYSGEIGMFHGIASWVSSPCDMDESAESYLEEKHEKWEGAMAVPFHQSEAQQKQSGKKIGYIVGGWVSS
jgi:hypothetical protein